MQQQVAPPTQMHPNQSHPQQSQQHPHMMQPNFAYPSYQYGYYTHQPGPVQVSFPTAQHATGTPLYANHHVQMYVPATPYYPYHHPGMMYPHMVPAEYAAIIDGNKDENSPEPTGQVQPMWHPAPMGWHPSMGQPLAHAEEFIPAEEIDEYNQYQPHPMEHQSPQVLSPIYAKDEHGYHGIHPHHQEFIAACGIPHLDPNQHHNLPPHHAHHQQQQLHQQQPPLQMQVHQEHHPQHHMAAMPQQLIMHPVDNNNLVINEFVSEEIVDENSSSGNESAADNALSHQQQPGADNIQTFNNNYEFDKSRNDVPNNNNNNNNNANVDNELNKQQTVIPETQTIPSVDQSIVYVANVVPVSVAKTASPAVQPNDVASPNAKHHNNNHQHINNNDSKAPALQHHNPFAQQQTVHSTTTTNSMSSHSVGPSSVMSTEELEKLALSTSDMFITKHEQRPEQRSADFNQKMVHNNNNNNNTNNVNNNNHHSNHKNSNSAWTYHNKKNTVNVSVSAVPMHSSPTVLLPTPKTPLIAHTPIHRSDYVNRSQSPSVPKPYVPKQQHHQQHHAVAASSNENHHNHHHHHHSAKYASHANHQSSSSIDVTPKPIVATTSIASTAVPQQLQHEQRSKQVEVVPQHLLHHINETPSVSLAEAPPSAAAPNTPSTTPSDEKPTNQVPREEITTAPVQLPSPTQTPTAVVPPSTNSWASLFASKLQSNRPAPIDLATNAKKAPVAKMPPLDSQTQSTAGNTKPSIAVVSSTSTTIPALVAAAQVLPDDTVAVAPKPPMSYSAASSQGLAAIPPVVGQQAKKQATKSTVAPTKPVVTNDEMSSLKLGGK